MILFLLNALLLGHTSSAAADYPPPPSNFRVFATGTSPDYFFNVRMKATIALASTAGYLGILFLPLVMASARSVSDIFCTSAEVKSWAPIFFPIAEPVPSAPWQAAHLALNVSAAPSARADRGRARTIANAVAIVSSGRLILFIFKLHSEFWLAQHLQ